jgi:hypothetical protein
MIKVAADWYLKTDRPIFPGELGACDKGVMGSKARYTAFETILKALRNK